MFDFLTLQLLQVIDPRFNINGNAIAVDKAIFGDVRFISNQIMHLSAVRNCQMLKLKNPEKP